MFLRAVFGFYRERAASVGAPDGRTGAVNRIQRFGSALNLNVHFHALVLDGVYSTASPFARPEFHEAAELTECDVQHLVETIRARVLRLLRTRGLLTDDGERSLGELHEQDDQLPLFQAASIQGRVALGPDAGAPLERLNRIAASGSRYRPPPLCAEVDGFSLHAAVRIAADDRDRLEHLCRYVARPPFAAERLSLAPDGRVLARAAPRLARWHNARGVQAASLPRTSRGAGASAACPSADLPRRSRAGFVVA